MRWLKAPSGMVERSLPWRVLEERERESEKQRVKQERISEY